MQKNIPYHITGKKSFAVVFGVIFTFYILYSVTYSMQLLYMFLFSVALYEIK